MAARSLEGARPDSDVDLCIVSDGAERQLEAARTWREAMWGIWACPAFTLLRFLSSDWRRNAPAAIIFLDRPRGRSAACSSNPADRLFIAESDLEGLRLLRQQELACSMCRSKLAEVVEKLIKAELIRLGWFLEKTHE